MSATSTFSDAIRRFPLLPAAALFLAGAAWNPLPVSYSWAAVIAASCAWLVWMIAELLLHSRWLAQAALALVLFAAGAALWPLNQWHVEATHIARYLPPDGEILVALRTEVEVPPDQTDTHGGRHLLVRTNALWTGYAWLPTTGELLVTANGLPSTTLRRGDIAELYGWLARPSNAQNPGAFNPREQLAADRIFAQVRIPHPAGIVLLDASAAAPQPLLARFRLFLHEKLLQHTLNENVPAAYTLNALLLGDRDPAMRDIAQSFADAGVAHLLAISGTHIAFFTALVWALLRFLPLRPRRREVLIAAIVTLYVLATPCGPPVLRAAIALLVVLFARLMGRPRQYLNMLCAAAMIIVLFRPTDIADAGFQLSFVTAAGLILLSGRVHAALFGAWLARETLVAELSRTRAAFWRVRVYRFLAAALAANLIGALTAAPMVAYHFGQINTWSIFTGILAFPIVCAAMMAAALQLLAEIAGLGALLAPFSAWIGKAMIWWIGNLAAWPAAVVPLRAPPIWLIIVVYVVVFLWIARRSLAISRAAIINGFLATFLMSVIWYFSTARTGKVQLTILDAGGGNSILMRTPRGDLWAINAGTGQSATSSVAAVALRPAMRLQGRRTLDGMIVTALDITHASEAGEVITAHRPRQIWLSAPAWKTHGQTVAGADLASAAAPASIHTLVRGQSLDVGDNCRVEALWPLPSERRASDAALILRIECDGKKILIADPANLEALAIVARDEHYDAVILTGVQRGQSDAEVRHLFEAAGKPPMVWSGRNIWAPSHPAAEEFNAADGALQITISTADVQIQPWNQNIK